MSDVPSSRLRELNKQPINSQGQFVLYWMTAFRRPFYNFALQRAVEHATKSGKPLMILEALRCDYPFANDRLHAFILQGMCNNAEHFSSTTAYYYPFVETTQGAGKGLLAELSKSACLIVSDDHPGFFFPKMLQAASQKVPVKLEAVDSNGLLPLRVTDQVFATAYSFRRFLQKTLPGHLFERPIQDPLQGIVLPKLEKLPETVAACWPAASKGQLASTEQALGKLPIDHNIAITDERGGWQNADIYLDRFLRERLPNYLQRSEPDRQVSSDLSPYLHFGHISAHQIVAQLFTQENWSIDRIAPETKEKKNGWWGVRAAAESFLDELITWREVGFNAACHLPAYDQFHTLPTWARETLSKHRVDPRPIRYLFEQFEQAKTHDRLWNAAQNQLVQEGRIQNYLRMLWGKKIFEWSPDAETALQTLQTLNDRYALDGRDPNSISGIFWCLGRYDRAWGPERPIYGKIRYMTSENTARKFSVKSYLRRYAPGKEPK